MTARSRIASIFLHSIIYSTFTYSSNDPFRISSLFDVSSSGAFLGPATSFGNFSTSTAFSTHDSSRPSQFSTSSPLQARKLMYKYDEVNVIPLEPSKDNPSLDGFVKQKCYDRPRSTDPTVTEPDEIEHYCIFANPTFSNNRGMVLFIRPSFLKKKLQDFVVFKTEDRVITDEQRSAFPYELVHMPHKGGLGSLATRKLQLGDRVVTDHALVTVFARAEKWKREEWKQMLKDMVDHLPIKGRELFARQHGVGNTELDWIASAFERNVFSASLDDEDQGGFAFIPEPAVNLNHGCRPNVAFYFDDLTLQLEMFAVRDIAPGEELFDSYFQLDFSWEVRQMTLHHHYGFKCQCSQCSLPPWGARISDDRILKIHELSAQLSNWTLQPPPTRAMADHLVELYKMEHMEASIDAAYSLAALTYNSYGESDKASMYASIAISYGIYINGPDWPSYQAHHLIETDPHSHWSYRSRLPGGQAGPNITAETNSMKEADDGEVTKEGTSFSIASDDKN